MAVKADILIFAICSFSATSHAYDGAEVSLPIVVWLTP